MCLKDNLTVVKQIQSISCAVTQLRALSVINDDNELSQFIFTVAGNTRHDESLVKAISVKHKGPMYD